MLTGSLAFAAAGALIAFGVATALAARRPTFTTRPPARVRAIRRCGSALLACT